MDTKVYRLGGLSNNLKGYDYIGYSYRAGRVVANPLVRPSAWRVARFFEATCQSLLTYMPNTDMVGPRASGRMSCGGGRRECVVVSFVWTILPD